MRVSHAVLVVALILSVTTASYAERILDKGEALKILGELTKRNQTTWIAAGTIEATHQAYKAPVTTDPDEIEKQIQQALKEHQANPDLLYPTEDLQTMYLQAIPFNVRYRLANESTTNSRVVVKYDGDRFYWEINVSSRSDSVEPTGDLIDNFMVECFDMRWNQDRIFTWDGTNYTICSASADYATVDAEGRFPRSVNGPLTAGFVAWGNGSLTYEDLIAGEIAAVEIERDGITQIQMRIDHADGASKELFLDPALDYAVTSCTFVQTNNTTVSVYCQGYRKVADRWVPGSILIEEYDSFTNRLRSSDQWDITGVDARTPQTSEFNISYSDNTFIEYLSPLSQETLQYRYSKGTDTDALLAERLAYVAARGKQKQNCGTSALKYAVSQLGKTVSDSRLAELVGPNGQTSMYDLKQQAEALGLHCRTFRADLSTLTDLSDCQIILHQSGKDHFVVVDRIDQKQAWIVDLSDRKFYYRQDVASLPGLGTDGTAMVLSRNPIGGPFASVPEPALRDLVGATNYQCTELIQKQLGIACPENCVGTFWFFWQRYGCAEAETGTCQWQVLMRYMTTACQLSLDNQCGALEWMYGYMNACR